MGTVVATSRLDAQEHRLVLLSHCGLRPDYQQLVHATGAPGRRLAERGVPCVERESFVDHLRLWVGAMPVGRAVWDCTPYDTLLSAGLTKHTLPGRPLSRANRGGICCRSKPTAAGMGAAAARGGTASLARRTAGGLLLDGLEGPGPSAAGAIVDGAQPMAFRDTPCEKRSRGMPVLLVSVGACNNSTGFVTTTETQFAPQTVKRAVCVRVCRCLASSAVPASGESESNSSRKSRERLCTHEDAPRRQDP